MNSHIVYTEVGPSAYHARPLWAGAVACYVRKNPATGLWETGGNLVEMTACPVAGASMTRHNAVMAYDYYHNELANHNELN
jgi:hypothetical protein